MNSNSNEMACKNKHPWDRLHEQFTVSRMCREDQWAQLATDINDDLDIALESTYNHETDFDASKAQVVKSPKTSNIENNNKNGEEKLTERSKTKSENYPKFYFTKPSNSYLNRTADDLHFEVSGRGFSRKPDGSYFKTTQQ